jgi:hypothetical protein
MKLEPSPRSLVGGFTGAILMGGLAAAWLIPPAQREAEISKCGNPVLMAFTGVIFSLAWGAGIGGQAAQTSCARAGALIGSQHAFPTLVILAIAGAFGTTMFAVVVAHLACGTICGFLGSRLGPRKSATHESA